MNLSEWADRVGVSTFTAYRWFREGTLPVPAERVGRLILVNAGVAEREPARTVLYARVSSHDQRSDLGRQVARLTGWAAGQGMAVAEVVVEVGSGMNGKRRRLARLLADATATTVVVEHRDRLARFGVEHLEAALSAQGRRIVVVDAGEVDDDLIGGRFALACMGAGGLETGRSRRSVALSVLLARQRPGREVSPGVPLRAGPEQ